ncbi:nuclear transport factor 2 family protein [Amycolatopsis sp. NPDC026612]|uniref:nuclear transport factor 2 family protein n=1 Tax=Amycolatopsis sp. NPDC026612 TaxID=3155466 RepID=UPI0033E9776D
MNSGRVGRATRGSVRAAGLVAALLVALLAAGCGTSSGSGQAAAKGDDRGDITQLIYRFYATMEDRQFDKLNVVLADGVVVKTPFGVTEGRDKVIAETAEAAKQEDRAQHVVTNVLVDVDGDKAKVRAFVDQLIGSSKAPAGKAGPAPSMTISSLMRYEATRTPDGWRVSHIEGDVLWATQAAAAPAGQ